MDYILQLNGLPPTSFLATTSEMSLTSNQRVRVVYDGVLETSQKYKNGQVYGEDYFFNDPYDPSNLDKYLKNIK